MSNADHDEIVRIVNDAFEADRNRQAIVAEEIRSRCSESTVDHFLLEKEKAAKEGRLL